MQLTGVATPLAYWLGWIERCDGVEAVVGIHDNDGLCWLGTLQATFQEIDLVVVVACGFGVTAAEESKAFARATQCTEMADEWRMAPLDAVLAVAVATGAVEHSRTFPWSG